MGDINFANNDPKNSAKSEEEAKNSNQHIRWSSPKGSDKLSLKEKEAPKLHSQVPSGGSEKEDSEILKQSRREVLEMIKQEKKEQKNKKSGKKQGFFSRIFNSADSGQDKKNKNSQEKIAEHQEEKKQEQEKRKGRPEAPDREKGEFSGLFHDRDNNEAGGSSKILETNLVNRTEDIEFNWNQFYIFLISGIFLAIVLVGFMYIWVLKEGEKIMARIEPINQEIEKSNLKMISFAKNAKEIDNFNKKISLAKEALENHIYWTNVFEILEKYTLSEVEYMGGFSGDLEGEFSLSAKAGGYDDVTNQLRVMKSENSAIKDVLISEAVYAVSDQNGSSTPEVGFTVSLVFDQSVFYK